MTRDDFDSWLDDFRAAFRDVDAWLSKMGTEEMAKTLGWWWRTLQGVSVDEAATATLMLYEQDQRMPSFSKIPAAVKAIALRVRGNTSNGLGRHFAAGGEETYRCLQCQDDGRVIIRVRTRPDESFSDYPYTAASACTCQAGDVWANRRRDALRRFRPGVDRLA